MRTVSLLRGGLLPMALAVLLASALFAQGPGGDRDRGRGGFNPGDFLRRMDSNGNGILEPNEIPDYARRRMEPMLREAGLDPGRPVALEKLSELYRRRYDRSRRDSSSEDRGDRSSRSSSTDDAETVLVPGFGNDFEDAPVPAFGEGEATGDNDWESEYNRRYLDRARDVLRRYDRNKNGVLDRAEWGRDWRPDPAESDRNKDGRLTLKELTERYAQREGDGSRDSSSRSSRSTSSRSGGSSGGSSRDSGGSSGGSRDSGDSDRISRFYRGMDRNGNGQLEPDEIPGYARRMVEPRIREAGFELGKPVPLDKLIESRRKSMADGDGGGGRGRGFRFGGGGGDSSSSSGGSSKTKSSKTKKSEDAKVAGFSRPKTAMERLPRGIDPSFIDADANRDALVSLGEFLAGGASRAKIAEFQKFDGNRDGLISAAEWLAQEDAPVTLNTSVSVAKKPAATSTPSKPAPSATGEKTVATPTTAGKAAESKYSEFIDSRFQKYDKNRNGVLESSEWWAKSRLMPTEKIDGNRDRRITRQEMVDYLRSRGG